MAAVCALACAVGVASSVACSSSSATGNGDGTGDTTTGDDAGSTGAPGNAAEAGSIADSAGPSRADSGGIDALDAGFDDPDAPAPTIKPAPANGVLMGAFVGVGTESESATDSEGLFTTAEGLLNRRWVIDNRFYNDTDDWTADRTQWDIQVHKVPHVTWMPYHTLDDIIAGKDDALYHQRAQAAKAFGTQIFMRWAHEMNGNWYPWSGAMNGSNAAAAAKYVTAWKHVHDIFVADGATNVVWVWCPLVTDVPSDSWNHWTNYYPGDDYVDWVGLDAYNWGSSSSCCQWESFDDLIDAPYQDYAAKKPIMLPETASAEVGGDKGAWIDAMHASLKTKYTAIHAVVWFDINKETDWRINSSATALAAYKNMALDSYFRP
jgi:hypothetical protein